MAECHPVAFRWVMEAKNRGATVIHVDPRFTRTSAVADLHVPIRPGSDIAFLGGIIRHVLEHDLWFEEYVRAYTNAATIVDERFQDTEDLQGLFSGFDGERNKYGEPSGPHSARLQTFRSQRLHRVNKAVATARESFDEAGFFGGIAKNIPEFFDGAVQAVFEIYEGVMRPQFLLQLLTGDDFAGALQQKLENLEGLLGKTNATAVLMEFTGRWVQCVGPETNAPWSLNRLWRQP